jgi:transcriptional regulator with XRE-family HTH domain
VEEKNMNLGKKIRLARRKCGLSQEQLAEKMSVSRSAIAKWETDKGLPDVGNLKILARLLGVSVDSLLDEEDTVSSPVIREEYHLTSYGYGCKKMQKDRAVRSKFPDAAIYPLLGQKDLANLEAQATPAPHCKSGGRGPIKDTDHAFYLIEKEGQQLLVTVSDSHLEAQPLELPLEETSFRMNGWSFIKCNYELSK